jgi:tetratricopeptide (TPR) repeat protein
MQALERPLLDRRKIPRKENQAVTTFLAVFIVCAAPCPNPLDDWEKGMRAAEAGEYARANELLTRALEDNPGFDHPTLGRTYFTRGRARYHLGQHALALVDFQVAEKALPAGARYPVLVYAGRSYLALEKPEEAVQKFNTAVRLDPNKPEVYLYRGQAQSGDDGAGRWDHAAADFGKAAELAAGNPEVSGLATVCRGRAYEAKGDYRRALADYERAVKLRPDWADGHSALAWLRATSPDAEFRHACDAAKHAFNAGKLDGWASPRHYEVLAAAAAEAGAFDEAHEFQEKALASPNYPQRERAAGKERLELYKQGKPYREPKR